MTTEDMIRALGNVIEEYKNKPVFTGQTDIPMMCRDVIGKLKELSSPWHTGKPTEDGYYLCHIQFYSEDYKSDEEGYDIPYWFKNGSWEENDENVRIIAWQKIYPYKEAING